MTEHQAQPASHPEDFTKPDFVYELDVSYDNGKSYERAGGASSIDDCKAIATRLRKTDSGYRMGLIFRLYFAGGNHLIHVGRDHGSWRLRWSPGNNRPRNQQAGESR